MPLVAVNHANATMYSLYVALENKFVVIYEGPSTTVEIPRAQFAFLPLTYYVSLFYIDMDNVIKSSNSHSTFSPFVHTTITTGMPAPRLRQKSRWQNVLRDEPKRGPTDRPLRSTGLRHLVF